MPEGDTVWLTADRLHRALAGRVLTVSDLRVPQLATVDVRGIEVEEVLARGKHLLIRLGDGRTLHNHLRMDGAWYLSRAGGPRPRRHAEHLIRVLLGNAEWLATGYRIHDLKFVAREAEDTVVGHLGPDLLGPDWDPDRAEGNIRTDPARPVGEALLDQRVLAGIGNMYKCEILFIEQLNPWTPVREVADVRALLETAYRLLRANRDHPEQSTTGYTERGREHWVYNRGGQPCLRCRTPIRRAEQGEAPQARVTYWCPRCQPATADDAGAKAPEAR